MSAQRVRVLTYSHDGFGLGHLRRNLRLVEALIRELPDAAVLMVIGSPAAHHFTFQAQIDYLKLPSLAKVANGHYVSHRLGLDRAQVTSLRSALALAAVEKFEPDLVLVDHYPLGVNRELEAALGHLRMLRPSTPIVLGWRDILDHPDRVRREWIDTGQVEAVERLFDRVLVYGSQHLYDPIAEYRLPAFVADRTTFTGYLLDPRVRANQPHPGRDPMVVCTLGGGEDGAPVGRAFLDAMSHLRVQGWSGALVTGPLMPPADHRTLAEDAERAGVACCPFVEDIGDLLNRADAVVAMAGYNTMCEVLAAGLAPVVVPRTAPRQEQLLRATRLADRGLATVVLPDQLTGKTLAAAIREQANCDRDETRSRLAASVDTDGLRTAASVLAASVGGVRIPA